MDAKWFSFQMPFEYRTAQPFGYQTNGCHLVSLCTYPVFKLAHWLIIWIPNHLKAELQKIRNSNVSCIQYLWPYYMSFNKIWNIPCRFERIWDKFGVEGNVRKAVAELDPANLKTKIDFFTGIAQWSPHSDMDSRGLWFKPRHGRRYIYSFIFCRIGSVVSGFESRSWFQMCMCVL